MATKFKKLVTVLMAICMIAATAAMAFALEEEIEDTSDTSFHLVTNATNSSAYDHTSFRKKDNRSAVYFRVNYVSHPKHRVTGWIQGRKSGGSAHDCSGGNYYTVNVKKTFKMTNYVIENGYRDARVKVGADKGNYNILKGVWSPDSK